MLSRCSLMAQVRLMAKWVKKWTVPSSSSDKEYIVAIDKDGNYGCSCPVWIFRRKECHHIQAVKDGVGEKLREKPEYVLAKVDQPVYDEENNKLYIPLVGIPDALLMEATICYNLLKHGYSMAEVRELRRIPASWTMRAINRHIEQHGEAKYPEGWYTH